MTARILIVDDSVSLRTAAEIALKTGGYSVEQAVDGSDRLEKASASPPDLIITDLNMPNMDGLTMIEAMRKVPQLAGLPIVFLTTESDPAMKQRAKAAGAAGWITKPFQTDTLVKIVKKVLGR